MGVFDIEKLIFSMTLRQKVAGLLVLHVPGFDHNVLHDFLETYQPAGLVFMHDNIPSSDAQLGKLTHGIQARLPYLFAIDEEGGPVTRLASDTFPAANWLGGQPVIATTDAFRCRTELLRQLGFNVNFGIVADLSDDADSFIASRTFGGNSVAVSERVSAATRASVNGTLSVLKHFPGHGETGEDSHVSLPSVKVTKDNWCGESALPFKAGVAAGAHMLMFGHLSFESVDVLPATLSPLWHRIAHDEIGFNGLSITDDMVMLAVSGDPRYRNHAANAIAALRAGNDLLLFVTEHGWAESRFDIDQLIDDIVYAVMQGELDEGLVQEALRRVLTTRASLSLN